METNGYTNIIENDLWDQAYNDYAENDDYGQLVTHINDPDFLRPFSDRLLFYYAEKKGIPVPESQEKRNMLRNDFAVELFHDLDVIGSTISRNTVKNWFQGKGNGPKMGADGRAMMYEVAFALHLDVPETEILFRRVYLNRAFAARSISETVFKYCLMNRKSYRDAKEIIKKVEVLQLPEDAASLGTKTIRYDVDCLSNDDDLIEYIVSHGQEFNNDNKTGKQYLEEKWEEIKNRLAGEYYELISPDPAPQKGSADFALDVMKYGTRGSSRTKEARDNWKKIRYEIRNQFPDKDSILKTDSPYVLRNNLIFVFFFWYWSNVLIDHHKERGSECGAKAPSFEEFTDNLNYILSECGFFELYYGNPYDYLFMYCSACYGVNEDPQDPIQIFHGIMSLDDE